MIFGILVATAILVFATIYIYTGVKSGISPHYLWIDLWVMLWLSVKNNDALILEFWQLKMARDAHLRDGPPTDSKNDGTEKATISTLDGENRD